MRVTRLSLRDFRSYEAAEVRLGPGLTVVAGRNGAGKTNLLEALYFACTGPLVPDGQRARGRALRRRRDAARARRASDDGGAHAHRPSASSPGEAKRLQVDGAPVERLTDAAARPLVSVFLPDRLELVMGAPALRRAHLDQVVAALWPARAGTRRALLRGARAAQRAAGGDPRRPRRPRLAAGLGRRARPPRDRADGRPRARRSTRLRRAVRRRTPSGLGLEGGARAALPAALAGADDAEALAAELAERTDADLERGFTGHGPHRDELVLERDGRELRAYGSRGQQRLGLLALLLAEREALADERGAAAADAARRRDVRARRRAAASGWSRSLRARRPERDHDHRARARARAPTTRDVVRARDRRRARAAAARAGEPRRPR